MMVVGNQMRELIETPRDSKPDKIPVLHRDSSLCANCYALTIEIAILHARIDRLQKLIEVPKTF